MKRWLWTCVGLLYSVMVFGQQDYQQRFGDAFNKNDMVALKEILQEWGNRVPEDADWYAAWFNYCLLRSKEDIIQLSTEPLSGEEDSLILTDSLGNEVGYMYGAVRTDSIWMKQAYDWIDKGIVKHSDRLDLRFGKMTTLFKEKEYDSFLSEAVQTLKRSVLNDNKWKWTNNEQIDTSEGKDVLLNSFQDYFGALFDTNTPKTDSVAMVLVDEVLKLYPDNMKFRTDKATVYFLNGDYDNALEHYLSVWKDYPEDTILIANIAYVYTLKEDYDNAILYYKKLQKYGDEEGKAFAKQKIEELKGKLEK